MGLSRRAYAKHRKDRGLLGQTEAAVRKALKTGRITALEDGTIDPQAADFDWGDATDPSKQRDANLTCELGVYDPSDDEIFGNDDLGGANLAAVTLADKRYVAEIRRLKLEEMRGALVNKSEVVAHVFELARKERDSWLQIPAQKSANMAAALGVAAHDMEMALDKMIRDHLAGLSDIKVDF